MAEVAGWLPRNRRCAHCATRARETFQRNVWGFRVRLCDDCIQELWRLLDIFTPYRTKPDAPIEEVGIA